MLNFKVLSTLDAEAILQKHRKLQRLYFALFGLLYSCGMVFFYVHIFFINAVFKVSIVDAVFWFIILPVHMIYFLFGNFWF